MAGNANSEPSVDSGPSDRSETGTLAGRSSYRSRRSCLVFGLAVFGLFFGVFGPVWAVGTGFVSVWDGLLGLVTSVTFLVLAFLVIDACLMKRDRVLFWLFVAVFFWPLVSAGISLLVLGQIPTGNIPWRFRMGGEGDPVSVQGLLQDMIGGGGALARWSMVLMLLTNISFLIPVGMIHRRVARGFDMVPVPGEKPARDGQQDGPADG